MLPRPATALAGDDANRRLYRETAPPPKTLDELIEDARAKLATAGIELDHLEINTADWQRKPRHDHIWYRADSGTGRSGRRWLMVTAGDAKQTGDVSTPLVVYKSWESDFVPLPPSDLAEINGQIEAATRQREQQEARRREAAAQQAQKLLAAGEREVASHPYLVRKGVSAHGLRLYRGDLIIHEMPCDGALMVPVRIAGELVSIQFINDDGEKRFLPGGAKRGGYHAIGKLDKRIYLAEGYATAATIQAATGEAVAVCFDAGNLRHVAEALRQTHPKADIVVCADDDRYTQGNPGTTKARTAAETVGGSYRVPAFKDRSTQPTDFNDLATLEGIGTVQSQLQSTTPITQTPLEGRTSDTGGSWPTPDPLPEHGNLAAARPFPFHRLPQATRAAVREVARFFKVPVVSPALVALSVTATAIGKQAIVEERRGLILYPALFFAGIAPTGERKTPVFRTMTQPLEDWAEEKTQEWEEATRKAKALNTAVETAIQTARKRAKSGADLDAVSREIADLEAERLPLPTPPRLFSSDPTEQRLFQLMHERDGAFAVMSGEGRPVIDAIMGKYSGEGRTGDAIYLAGISGDTITRDRVGGSAEGPEQRVIRRPCLNVCIMVQPDKYLEAASHPALRASGALARIWPAWFPSLVGTRLEADDEPGLDEDALKPYNAFVRRLLSEETPKDAQGRPRPHRATLSAEAAKLRRAFHNRVESMMNSGEALEDCRDIASKAVSQTVKLALDLHLAENPDVIAQPSSEISAETWAAAEDLGSWFLEEAVRVQRMADEDPTLETARRALRWLRKARLETVTARHLEREMTRPRPKAQEARVVLELLADHGYLRDISHTGARSPTYRVTPALLSPKSPLSPGDAGKVKNQDSASRPATLATMATPEHPMDDADLPHEEVF
ncbi:MAG: DUF3987 domain-containing protein [Pseudomonadota bacterium]|nr:DUF3987 domain-containing protein [Pseudomonadota bacterium]